MRTLIAIISLVGFSLSTIIHMLAIFGMNMVSYVPYIWYMHFGILALAIPTIIFFNIDGLGKRNFWGHFFEPMPIYTKTFLKVVGFYFIINFAIMTYLLKFGTPDVWGTKLVLQSHGTIIEELSVEEYNKNFNYVVRMFSGGWIYFYAIPSLYFFYDRNR